ncbi:F-box family protein [Dorcoceras hygrometricum]|uniref:F-box family protein n=1 Tax=Dorcoceras hygrometricum TaxID=472368 RepID=A0A2Z7C770_9LAMI|nr:F-box family protein [Dorcoceras hygrometricum]
METSKVESVVRNQAEAKFNQLERSESAGTMSRPAASARDKATETTASWNYKELAGTSSKNDQQAATVQPVEGTQVSDSKTMSFTYVGTTAFCLRAKIQQMVCDDTTSWCKSNDDQLECKSNVNQQLVATVHSDESYSRPAVDMHPVAKIQTQR